MRAQRPQDCRGNASVADGSCDEHTIDDLIAALEQAPAGSAELDRMVAFQLGLPIGDSDEMIKLLLFEGYGWDVISEIVDSNDPSFTRSLDARIPGENIVLSMHSAKRGKWAAIHRGAGGTDFVAWAATEVLARRAAALRGLRAVSSFDMRAAAHTPKRPTAVARPDETAVPPALSRDELSPGEGEAPAPDFPSGSPDPGEWKILF